MKNRMVSQLKWFLYGIYILLFSPTILAVTVTISGTLYSDEGITPITSADQTIHLVIDGVSTGTDTTDASGNYVITATITPTNPYYLPLLVYVDDEIIKATTVTQMDSVISNTLSNLDIYANHLIIRQDGSSAPLDTGDMLNAKGALSDPDILYTIAWPDTVVTGTNTKLYIANGYIYEPAGDVTTHHMHIEGTLNANNHTFNISGDWDFTNGVFNRGTSTVNFTGTGTISNDVFAWWGKSFNKINMATAGQTTTILVGRGIVARDIVTLDGGTLAGGTLIVTKGTTPLINNGGTFANNSIKFSPPGNQAQFYIPVDNYPNIWLASNGTITDTIFIPLGNINCSRLTIYGNGLGKTSILETNGHNISCNNLRVGHPSTNRMGKLTINNGSTLNIANDIIIYGTGSNELDATSSAINIGRHWFNNSLFTAGTSTVNFNGNTNQTLSAGGNPFYNVTIDNTGAVNSNIITIDSDITLNNDLIINDGVLDTTTNNYNLTVLGNFDQSSTTGELEANASILTITGNFSADGSIDSTNYNNASVEFIGSGSLSYTNMAGPSGNGFKNLTVGKLGQTTTLIPSITFNVKEVLTVGSGSLSSTGIAIIYIEGSGNPLNLDPNATIKLYSLRFFNNGSVQYLPPLINGYDTSIDLSSGNTNVIQTGDITLHAGKGLNITGDGFPNRVANYNTNGFDLNVGGRIRIGGWIGSGTAPKTLDISNSTVTVGRDFLINPGTNYLNSTDSTVILNGTSAQAVTMNSNAMNTLILNNTSSGGVSFNDAFTANTVTNTTPNSTMTFAAGQDFTVNSAINIQGASGQLINLVSSSPGSNWNFILNSGATKTIDNVSVSWSDASGSHSTQTPINPTNTARDSNTIDWFPQPNITVTKNTTLISDPTNGTGGGKNRIPGAIIEYSITTRNTGGYSPDSSTVVVLDVIDSNLEFDVTTGISFTDGTPSSGVTLGAITYSHRSTPTSYTYTPTGSFDPNIAGIKIKTNGTFAFGGTPSFTITYQVRLK